MTLTPPSKPTFEFQNQVSPRYVEPLFLKLEYGTWYSQADLRLLLRSGGLDLKGDGIVRNNSAVWTLIGLGRSRSVMSGGRIPSRLFQLSELGREVAATYSTNRELFFDLMHFFFYSTWIKTRQIARARFWLYTNMCDVLWSEAPSAIDSFQLTNRLQIECRSEFPGQNPSFSERSARSVFPWLGALTPSFLAKCDKRSQLCSERRSYCTPQLFHLAVDLIYSTQGLRYGTSMAIDDGRIAAICRTCLLDVDRFWYMTELTQMAVRGFDIQRGQWGTSIILGGPPTWIDLPDFTPDHLDLSDDEVEEEDVT